MRDSEHRHIEGCYNSPYNYYFVEDICYIFVKLIISIAYYALYCYFVLVEKYVKLLPRQISNMRRYFRVK
jgi:hypothetical protein